MREFTWARRASPPRAAEVSLRILRQLCRKTLFCRRNNTPQDLYPSQTVQILWWSVVETHALCSRTARATQQPPGTRLRRGQRLIHCGALRARSAFSILHQVALLRQTSCMMQSQESQGQAPRPAARRFGASAGHRLCIA